MPNVLEESYNGTPGAAITLMTFPVPATGLWHCYLLASVNIAYAVVFEHFLVGNPPGGLAGRPLGQIFNLLANTSYTFPFQLPAAAGDTFIIRTTAGFGGYASVSFIGIYMGQAPEAS